MATVALFSVGMVCRTHMAPSRARTTSTQE